jgi:hypothetical protein
MGVGFASAGLAPGGGLAGAVVGAGAAVASSNAANGWKVVCDAVSTGVGAGDRCDWANDEVELTSDAILDTGKPLKAKGWHCRLQPPRQRALVQNQRKFNGLGATVTRSDAAVFARPGKFCRPFAAGAGEPIVDDRGGAAGRRL